MVNGQAQNLKVGTNSYIRTCGAALILAAGVAVSGCAQDKVHGNFIDPEVAAEIKPGAQRRQDVVSLLGSPSALSTFEDGTWFYIGQRTNQYAFFNPTVLERRILVISFDENGVVQQTKNLSLADANEISPSGRITPTEGRELTFLQQLFGNLGRFPTEGFQDGSGSGGRPPGL